MNGLTWIMLVLAAIIGACMFAAIGAVLFIVMLAYVSDQLTRDDDNRGDY
ncbi:hypothetical protein [Paraburkholderia rhynchosiae]|uniref:Uncharacterized protein n=1 Tax=Paraburkholderia rhynchosiae TaxID=487049 RepID=A0A6J4ZP55_9BURK|nr:hypothetical protein [Paraburkholderia rhynchosiae]CAB3638332.1 hypothetical protein LMG27174_00306 [Paraburkholderia rhynchosiae]